MSGSPDVGGRLRQSTMLEVDSGYSRVNADVNNSGVAGKSKFRRRISDNGVLELLEGHRGDLSHRHCYRALVTERVL